MVILFWYCWMKVFTNWKNMKHWWRQKNLCQKLRCLLGRGVINSLSRKYRKKELVKDKSINLGEPGVGAHGCTLNRCFSCYVFCYELWQKIVCHFSFVCIYQQVINSIIRQLKIMIWTWYILFLQETMWCLHIFLICLCNVYTYFDLPLWFFNDLKICTSTFCK